VKKERPSFTSWAVASMVAPQAQRTVFIAASMPSFILAKLTRLKLTREERRLFRNGTAGSDLARLFSRHLPAGAKFASAAAIP
jgi:hypothetical protein